MSHETWTTVDRYIADQFIPHDEAFDAALKDSDAAGLPAIAVSTAQGKWLHLLARAIGARRIMEIGTLGGFSGIWLARALPPDGRLITLEISAKHAEVARRNFARAGVVDRAEVVVGPALETLPGLSGPFDLIFIDADKKNNLEYFQWALRLARIGSLIIVDNVVRGGAIIDRSSQDVSVQGTRRCLEMMSAEPRVITTALQTVGSKGYDGFAIAMVTS
jgi:predicted O-methyltransferase YrrM